MIQVYEIKYKIKQMACIYFASVIQIRLTENNCRIYKLKCIS